MIANEIKEGADLQRTATSTVEAFLVKHGNLAQWPMDFRFTTPDKVIVISGDTRPCENIIKIQ